MKKEHRSLISSGRQTNSGQLIEGVSEKPLQQVPQFLSSNNEALTDAILVLLRTHFMVLQVEEEEGAETTQSVLRSVFLSNSHEICKPLAEALPKLATHCWNSEKSAMLFSLYATYALEFSRGLEKVCAEHSSECSLENLLWSRLRPNSSSWSHSASSVGTF
ncbi:hypothetical protein BC830DRAFT_444358 [Chytriomyces sp. MP71]|nr:hypothetical protein BC830DRAFT_444358 [Chytriomyces sp. MP71]